jgi:hypothetical protein
MRHCHKQIGDESFRSPRNTIKEFLDLLATLEQNPQASWEELLGHVKVHKDRGESLLGAPDDEDDELVSFTL